MKYGPEKRADVMDLEKYGQCSATYYGPKRNMGNALLHIMDLRKYRPCADGPEETRAAFREISSDVKKYGQCAWVYCGPEEIWAVFREMSRTHLKTHMGLLWT